MRRGTTPTISFLLPFEVEQVDRLWFTVSQRGMELFTKELEDMVVDGPKLSVKLKQEDTLRLTAGQKIEVQVRIRTKGGDALTSNIAVEDVGKILKDGVI